MPSGLRTRTLLSPITMWQPTTLHHCKPTFYLCHSILCLMVQHFTMYLRLPPLYLNLSTIFLSQWHLMVLLPTMWNRF
jgi:hypothetical protein